MVKDRSKLIGQEKAIALIKQEFGTAISKAKRGDRIFRGRNETGENQLYLVKPSLHRRSSKESYDLYNTLLDFIPSWKGWPKRSWSVIGSSNMDGAKPYGAVHFVFPRNRARIGVCSRSDLWGSFPSLNRRLSIDQMDVFNEDLAVIIARSLNIQNEDKFYSSKYCLEKFNEFFKLSKKEVLNSVDPYEVSLNSNILGDIDKNFKGNWMKYFSDLMDPIANKFQLTTIEEYSSKKYKNNEVWTDADCIMLNGGIWDDDAKQILRSFLSKKQWADL